jgi:UPF0042 nucleotide-binding protein
MDVLVVSGMSGAGKTTALHALEDLGFYCVDNLPASLLSQLIDVVKSDGDNRRLAVGMDARDYLRLADLPEARAQVAQAGHRFSLLFLDASDAVLLRRYAQTRRRHPFGELPAALTVERERLASVRSSATSVIDTERLSARELRALISERYASSENFGLFLLSFGFKYGVPLEADVMFDARFLTNPFDYPELRPLTGLAPSVRDFVLAMPDAQAMLNMVESWIDFHVPRAMAEGRAALTLAVGCTGGQHRSVALIEALSNRLTNREGGPPARIRHRHRDIGNEAHV